MLGALDILQHDHHTNIRRLLFESVALLRLLVLLAQETAQRDHLGVVQCHIAVMIGGAVVTCCCRRGTIGRSLHQLVSEGLLVAVQRFNHENVIAIAATQYVRRRAACVLLIVYASITVLMKICSIYR